MGDLENTHSWHNDEELFQTFGGIFRFVSINAEEEWLQEKVKFNNQEINLMICLEKNSEPIGIISVREIDWISRNAQLTGIAIGDPNYRGKGYGTEALKLLLQHYFEDLNMNRIWGYALSENKPSLRMLEKCGFKIEGELRNHVFKYGQYKDVTIVGLCAKEYFIDQKE